MLQDNEESMVWVKEKIMHDEKRKRCCRKKKRCCGKIKYAAGQDKFARGQEVKKMWDKEKRP